MRGQQTGNGTPPAVIKPTPGTDLELYDFGDDADSGFQNTRKEELLTPFLAIIQSNSPQLDPASPVYLDAAKVGMLINTATQQLYDGRKGIDIVPCSREYHYGLWRPRDLDGGFRGVTTPEDPQILELIRKHGHFRMPRYRDGRWTADPYRMEDGEDVEAVEEFDLYALVAPPPIELENAERAVIAFTSTKIGVYKAWYNRAGALKYPVNGALRRPPIWAHRWRLTTVRQENGKGVWYNFALDLAARADNPEAGPRDSLISAAEPLYEMGRDFSRLVEAGEVKVDRAAAESGGAAGASGGADDVPF